MDTSTGSVIVDICTETHGAVGMPPQWQVKGLKDFLIDETNYLPIRLHNQSQTIVKSKPNQLLTN